MASEAKTAVISIKPSVNNMAVRVFVRAAGLDFSETDVWGNTRYAGISGDETRRI